MSHLTKFATSLDDGKKIERALVWLGLSYKKNVKIRTLNKVEPSEIVILSPNSWDIGLSKDNNGLYTIIGDSVSWNGLENVPRLSAALRKVRGDDRKEVFAGILTQACAITTAMIEAEKQGHEMIISDPDENGTIRARVKEKV